MNKNSFVISLLYGTVPGRSILKLILKFHIDCLIVRFLWSPLSRPLIGWYIRRNQIPIDNQQINNFPSFRCFFARERKRNVVDLFPDHLISPCDSWMSAVALRKDQSFVIKGCRYRLEDLIGDSKIAERFRGGICLIFRLTASDYHHYCYIDDGYQGAIHFMPGVLHSVQPVACETYPVYTLNRRCWCLMTTEHFGPVIQTEIGALVVGNICNERENSRFCRGEEKGHFELAGSTIVQFFEPNRIRLLPEYEQVAKTGREVRVEQGKWIGNRVVHAFPVP